MKQKPRLSKPIDKGIHCRCFVLVLLTIVPSVGLAIDEVTAQARCNAPGKQEVSLRYDDFRWRYDQDQMAARFTEIYESGKRLPDRARWSDKNNGYELVYKSGKLEKSVPISQVFIDSVTNHIERGLELGYFNHVFFPDMGHAHLLIYQPYYENVIRQIPTWRLHEVYTLVLAHPETHFLYHTAEQLKMLDQQHRLLPDKYLGWRYFTRNIVARNNALGKLDIYRNLASIGNTVCDTQSRHRYWSAGFHLSASKNGCFTYSHEQKIYHFDISLSDLPASVGKFGPLSQIEDAPADQHSSESIDLWGAHACSQQ